MSNCLLNAAIELRVYQGRGFFASGGEEKGQKAPILELGGASKIYVGSMRGGGKGELRRSLGPTLLATK